MPSRSNGAGGSFGCRMHGPNSDLQTGRNFSVFVHENAALALQDTELVENDSRRPWRPAGCHLDLGVNFPCPMRYTFSSSIIEAHSPNVWACKTYRVSRIGTEGLTHMDSISYGWVFESGWWLGKSEQKLLASVHLDREQLNLYLGSRAQVLQARSSCVILIRALSCSSLQ